MIINTGNRTDIPAYFSDWFYNRIKEGYNTSLKIGIFYSLIMACVFLFFNIPIIKLFIKDETTIIISSYYL